MSTLRILRRRIRSIQNTQQITKAMEMVAAAKLRKAQARAQAARPYAVKITEMLANLAAAAGELEDPLFQAREVKRTALVVVTADRGLSGAYNSNLIRAAEQRLRAAQPGSIQLVLLGRKGRDYFRRRKYPVLATHQDLIARYLKGEVDRVEILFTQFVSALRRNLVTEVFLPVGTERPQDAPKGGDPIFEPDAETIFAELLPRYATAKLFAALADALASQYSAQMIAMGAARKNAGELIERLVLQRNRLRQAAITKELLDIVGGAEALK